MIPSVPGRTPEEERYEDAPEDEPQIALPEIRRPQGMTVRVRLILYALFFGVVLSMLLGCFFSVLWTLGTDRRSFSQYSNTPIPISGGQAFFTTLLTFATLMT